MCVVQIPPPRQCAECLVSGGPLLSPQPRRPLPLGRSERVVQVRRLELANDLVEDLLVAGGVGLVRQHIAKALEPRIVRLGCGQRCLVVLPRRRGILQAPLRIEVRQVGVVQARSPGQAGERPLADGLLVLPLLVRLAFRRLLQCRLGRLNDPAAVREGLRFTVGVAEDLALGIAQEHRAGGVFQDCRFPAREVGVLFLDPALRRLDDPPPFSEREGSALQV